MIIDNKAIKERMREVAIKEPNLERCCLRINF